MSGALPVRPAESKPVRVLAAVGAASTAVVGGLAAIPGVPGWVPAVVAVLGLGLTVGVGRFTEARTTPWEEVAARTSGVNPGEFVAGPASPVKTGAVVDVTADVGPSYSSRMDGLP